LTVQCHDHSVEFFSDLLARSGRFKKQSVPDGLEPVPASAWLFEKGLKKDAKIWEQSVGLPGYEAVLSLLVMREPVERERERQEIR
jgi:hypothetical protein